MSSNSNIESPDEFDLGEFDLGDSDDPPTTASDAQNENSKPNANNAESLGASVEPIAIDSSASYVDEYLKEGLERMPNCSEKRLAALICTIQDFVRQQKIAAGSPGTSSEEMINKLKADYEHLNKCLVDEYTFDELKVAEIAEQTNKIARSFEVMSDAWSLFEWQTLASSFSLLLEVLRPMDFDKMFRLMKETKNSEIVIQDQDVVLLLGKTGWGKSTTLHYLAGSKMTQSVNSINVDEKELKNMNSDLKKVRISASANSETKYLTPVEVVLRPILNKAGAIYLCDTPGFDDTAGAEVDIANAFGLIEAISNCKSVILVPVICYNGVGGKYEGIIDMAQLLARMAIRVDDILDSVYYLYTRFPPGYKIKNMLEEAAQRKDLPNLIIDIIYDMIKKCEPEAPLVDPLNALDAIKHLKSILILDRLNEPGEKFQKFSTSTSLSKLKLQLVKHEKAVFSAIKRNDFELVLYKLGQLKELKTHLSTLTWLEDDYQSMVNEIRSHFEELFQSSLAIINSQIKSDNKLTPDNIESYKKAIERFRLCKAIVVNHFVESNKIDYDRYLLEHIVDTAENISKHIHQDNDCSENMLENMHLLVDHFPESVRPVYEKLYNELLAKFNSGKDDLNSVQDPLDIDVVTHKLRTLKKLYEIISLCALKQNMNAGTDFNSTTQHLLDRLRTQASNLLDKYGLEEDFREQISMFLSKLSAASSNSNFCTFLDSQSLLGVKKSVTDRLKGKIEEMNESISEIIKQEIQEDSLERIKLFFDQVQKLRKFSELESICSSQFNECKEHLVTFVTTINQSISSAIESFHNSQENENFEKIGILFQVMRDASWLNEAKQNLYSNSVKKNENDLLRQVSSLSKQLINLDLELKNYENINEAFKLYSKIKLIEPLSEKAQVITKCVAEAIGHCKTQMESSFSLMKKTFTFEDMTTNPPACKPLERTPSLTGDPEENHNQDTNRDKNVLWFPRLDGNFLDLSIKFLDEIEKHRTKLFRTEARTHKKDLEDYLFRFSRFVETNFNNSLKLIDSRQENANEITEDDVKKSVQMMSSYLRDLLALRAQYESVYAKLTFENTTILEKLNEILNAHARVLNQKMTNLQLQADNSRLGINMSNALILSYLDSKIEKKADTKSFTEIHKFFSMQNFNDAKDSINKITLHLKDHKYRGIALELTAIENMKISKSSLNQIRHSISMSLQSLIDGAKSLERRIDRNLSDDYAQKLADSLKLLKVADTELFVLLNSPNDQKSSSDSNIPQVLEETVKAEIKDTMKSVSSRLKTKFSGFLDSINKAIAENDFKQAEIIRDKYEKVFMFLGDYLILSADQEEQNLQTKFHGIETKFEAHLDVIIQEYEKISIEEYQIKCPRALIDRLKKASSAKYQDAAQKIEESILKKIRQFMRLKENYGDQSSKDPSIVRLSATERFDFVEHLLWYLPADLETLLNKELDRVKSEYKGMSTRKIREAEHILKQNEIDKLLEFIEKNKEFEETINSTNQQIVTHVQAIASEIIKDLDQNESLEKIGTNMNDLANYHDKFKGKMREIETCFRKVNDSIKKKYEIICKDLATIIYSSADDSPAEIEKRFNDLLVIIDFSQRTPRIVEIEPEAVADQVSQLFAFFENNYNRFFTALNDFDAEKVVQEYKLSAKWAGLFKKLTKAPLSPADNQKKESIMHSKLADLLIAESNKLKAEVQNVDPDNAAIFKYEAERNRIFTSIKKKYVFFTNLEDHAELVRLSKINFNAINKEVKKMIEIIGSSIETKLKLIVDNQQIAKKDFERLRLNFENLISLEKFFASITVSVSGSIRENLIKKCRHHANEAKKPLADLNEVAKSLITLQRYSDNLPSLKQDIDSMIGVSLEEFRKNSSNTKLIELCAELESDEVGASITASFEVFKGELIYRFFVKTKGHGIKYVIEKLEGDLIDKDKILKCFSKYDSCYDRLVKDNLKSTNFVTVIKDEIDQILKEALPKVASWSESLKESLPKLIAHIAAIWTLKNKKYHDEVEDLSRKDAYLLRPHPVQIVAIFRLLGIGLKNKESNGQKISNNSSNLVQVSTGEGKSAVLAITSCVLALLGKEVSCACYSEYLSNRDYDSFKDIFDDLGIRNLIFYGTFNTICERILNESFVIREKVSELIKDNTISIQRVGELRPPKVLLIDEVDVFFSKEFLGKLYVPTASLKHPTITSLLDFIWKSNHSLISLETIRVSNEYEQCKAQFTAWMDLIDESLKNVLFDLKTYKSHDYLVLNDKIAYREQDGISFNTVYGYKTLFAYYDEHDKGNINRKSLEQNKSLQIISGCFSYSEISKSFPLTLGVSGTLRSLNETQKELLKKTYDIRYHTYMPSVYGDNKCEFKEEAYTTITNKDDFNMRLREEINKKILGKQSPEQKRAVLVFFETKKCLNSFYNSDQIKDIKSLVNILTEETTLKDRETFIKDATRSGQITFLTRIFGRGIDFVCRNQTLLANGGVHVIQTFLSEDESEEVQIRGRTARQGEDGSYSMVLMDEDLEVFLDQDFKKTIADIRSLDKVYQTLHEARKKYFTDINKQNDLAVESALKDHKTSNDFLMNFAANKIEEVKKFLLESNKGPNPDEDMGTIEKSRTICLMDATGSMKNVLASAKNTVLTMFERLRTILQEKFIPPDSFELEFTVYRDYDNLENIIQTSGFESNPLNLRKFMETVKPMGNSTTEEAVEIGLMHAYHRAQKNKITQVILIGDAAAKPRKQIENDRKKHGGEDYWTKKLGGLVDYKFVLGLLLKSSIPVFTFYLDDKCRQNFEEIAAETGGTCASMNIKSDESATILTDQISLRVLHDLEKKHGGVDLVGEYSRRFLKAYK